MNQPRQPKAHIPVESAHTDATGAIQQHGVPVHASDEEPVGYPTSDRHHSENSLHPDGGDVDRAKHDHAPVERKKK